MCVYRVLSENVGVCRDLGEVCVCIDIWVGVCVCVCIKIWMEGCVCVYRDLHQVCVYGDFGRTGNVYLWYVCVSGHFG